LLELAVDAADGEGGGSGFGRWCHGGWCKRWMQCSQ
jgi:hypothetical protein